MHAQAHNNGAIYASHGLICVSHMQAIQTISVFGRRADRVHCLNPSNSDGTSVKYGVLFVCVHCTHAYRHRKIGDSKCLREEGIRNIRELNRLAYIVYMSWNVLFHYGLRGAHTICFSFLLCSLFFCTSIAWCSSFVALFAMLLLLLLLLSKHFVILVLVLSLPCCRPLWKLLDKHRVSFEHIRKARRWHMKQHSVTWPNYNVHISHSAEWEFCPNSERTYFSFAIWTNLVNMPDTRKWEIIYRPTIVCHISHIFHTHHSKH